MRFGKVRQILAKPGLYVHAPAPFDEVEWLRRDEVRSVALGFKHRAEPAAADRPDADEGPGLGAAAAVVTGDENLLGSVPNVDISGSKVWQINTLENIVSKSVTLPVRYWVPTPLQRWSPPRPKRPAWRM